MLAGPPSTMGHRKDIDLMGFVRLLLVCHAWFILNYSYLS